jgi:hypothetical protein
LRHADGDASALQVVATQSNVAEVLSALESAFRLRVNTRTCLEQKFGDQDGRGDICGAI